MSALLQGVMYRGNKIRPMRDVVVLNENAVVRSRQYAGDLLSHGGVPTAAANEKVD